MLKTLNGFLAEKLGHLCLTRLVSDLGIACDTREGLTYAESVLKNLIKFDLVKIIFDPISCKFAISISAIISIVFKHCRIFKRLPNV